MCARKEARVRARSSILLHANVSSGSADPLVGRDNGCSKFGTAGAETALRKVR